MTTNRQLDLDLASLLMSLASLLDGRGIWEAHAAETARHSAWVGQSSKYADEEAEFFIRNLDDGPNRDALNLLLSIYVVMKRL